MQPGHACRYVDSGTVLNNYAHIFDLLIRLRQAVNHPYLVVYSASGNKSAPGGTLLAGANGANTSSTGLQPSLLRRCRYLLVPEIERPSFSARHTADGARVLYGDSTAPCVCVLLSRVPEPLPHAWTEMAAL